MSEKPAPALRAAAIDVPDEFPRWLPLSPGLIGIGMVVCNRGVEIEMEVGAPRLRVSRT